MPVASVSARRKRAVESFQTAAECIGKLEKGSSLFAITRGQFSMIDAILACLDQCGPAKVSLWTWTIAEYEIQCLERLRNDNRITEATLVIDHIGIKKNRTLLNQWQDQFGAQSVRFVVNHSKIATISDGNFTLLLRGSMNLNFNPRFEQFDLTEGGEDYELVKRIESELEILPITCNGAEVYKSSKVSSAFDKETLDLFSQTKVWAK
jgi:hypothetical protein